MSAAESSVGPPAASSRPFAALWIAFTLFVVYGCLIPFHFTFDRAAAWDKLARVSLNPLISPDTGRRVSIPDVVQNILLFVPFGALGVLNLRARRSAAASILIVVSLAAATSTLVETLQLFEIDRTTSFSDVCTNVSGALFGGIAGLILSTMSRALLLRLHARRVVDVPAFYPMMIAAIVLCVAAWEPFDFTLDVGTLLGKLHALRADVWQLGATRDEGVELVRYLLFGLASSIWLRQLGVKSAAAVAACAGAAVAFGLEASQWIIGSRMPGLEDAAVHAAGAIAGSALSLPWPYGRSQTFWYALLWAATAAGAALQMLSPFELTPVHQPLQWMLFANYYQHTTFDALSHTFELVLIYFPLGFLAPGATQRPVRALLAATIFTVLIALPVEYVQGWIVGRYGDVTDIALAAAGTACGVWTGAAGWRRFRDWSAALTVEARPQP